MPRLIALFLFGFPLWLAAQFPLGAVLQQLVNDPQLVGTKWSICAVDLTTGDTIAAYLPAQQLPGASITKLVSTAAALEILGPNHQAKTQLFLDGELKAHGVFDGNIWIVGGGDVSLGSRYFNEPGNELAFLDSWVKIIQNLGIQYITGQVIADASAFGYDKCPVGWERLDMGNYYGCGAYGLNFFDNTLKLTFQTGAPGTPLVLKSSYPSDSNYQLGIEAKAANVNGDETFIHGEPYNYQRVIKGRLPANRAAFEVKGSMPDPEQLLARMFYQELQKQGVRVDGGSTAVRLHPELPAQRTENWSCVHTEFGQQLENVVYWTNQRSINLFAEGLVRQVGAAQYGMGTYENGLRALDSLFLVWQLGTNGIVDGSGLSKVNRMSASQYVKLLALQTQKTHFQVYLKSLPIAGQTGTVKNLCKGQPGEGKVHAKSGSINGIKAYAGYVDAPNGHQIAFAIIANDYKLSGSAMAKKMEPFFNQLATFQAQPE
jgi:D-alanyl-D-alanine carboxypeptidase/D-alanyl-D-alanine-endopeptidase (penicillin-binding protein 4)